MRYRQDCPLCGRAMYYVWPSPSDDPEVEAQLGRLQECRNQWCIDRHGNYQVDVLTGERHTFLRENGTLYIDGKPYPHINQWVRAVLLKAGEA